MKKRKNAILKKPVFWKMFIMRLLIFAVVAVLVGVVGTNIASRFYGMYMESETNSTGNVFADEVFRQYESNGDRERFEQSVSLSTNLYSWGNRIYAVVDGATGEVVASPSEDTLFLTAYYVAEEVGSLYPKTDVYTCESAEIVNAIKESLVATGYNQSSIYISMDDFYLKGYSFIPGKIKIMTYGNVEDSVLAELDFTPEDTAGYEHIGVGDNVGFAYGDPTYFELWLTPGVIQYMEEAVAKLDEWDSYLVPSDTLFNDLGSPGDNTCLYYTSIETGKEISEEGYLIVGFCHYNFFENFIWECMLSYAALMIITLALAIVTSNVSYMKQKNFYEMDQYRKDITNTMAHDLKSPLMVISGYAENLLEQDLPEKAQHFTESIMENTTYMNQIIEKTLELSKVENAGYTLHKESVNLREISEELIKGYMPQLEENGLEIQMTGDNILTADNISITEVLDNLIGNAVKYAMEGSVIEIHLSNKAYEISNVSAVDFDMDVKDLLKPFVKGDNSRSGKSGSGIGLTIAKNLCEQHGYELDVDCKDGTFIARVVW